MSDQVSGKSTKFGKVKITSNNMDHHSCAEEYSGNIFNTLRARFCFFLIA